MICPPKHQLHLGAQGVKAQSQETLILSSGQIPPAPAHLGALSHAFGASLEVEIPLGAVVNVKQNPMRESAVQGLAHSIPPPLPIRGDERHPSLPPSEQSSYLSSAAERDEKITALVSARPGFKSWLCY